MEYVFTFGAESINLSGAFSRLGSPGSSVSGLVSEVISNALSFSCYDLGSIPS